MHGHATVMYGHAWSCMVMPRSSRRFTGGLPVMTCAAFLCPPHGWRTRWLRTGFRMLSPITRSMPHARLSVCGRVHICPRWPCITLAPWRKRVGIWCISSLPLPICRMRLLLPSSDGRILPGPVTESALTACKSQQDEFFGRLHRGHTLMGRATDVSLRPRRVMISSQ